jgi:hypothetical protein
MREQYPEMNLFGHDHKYFNSLFKSLRFSTHFNFNIISNHECLDISSCHHFLFKNSDRFNLTECDNSFSMGFLNDSFLFCKGALNENMVGVNPKDEKLLSQSIEKFLNKIEHTWKKTNLTIDFLINYEGRAVFIGAQENSENSVKVYSSESNYSDTFVLCFDDKLNSKNFIARYELSQQKKEKIKIEFFEQQYCSHWDLYRACGINIPLLIVQNLLLRDFKTFKFINDSEISMKANSLSQINYKFSFDTVFFDLDETLICKGMPIHEVIAKLCFFIKTGKKVNLLTRHKGRIGDALKSIKLDESIFDKVVFVSLDKLKSEYIFTNSIFIDNEFPQRFDVMKNCQVPCLDLDQLDFLN